MISRGRRLTNQLSGADAQLLMTDLLTLFGGHTRDTASAVDRTIRDHIRDTVVPQVLDDAQGLIDTHANALADGGVFGHAASSDEILFADGLGSLSDDISRRQTFRSETQAGLRGYSEGSGTPGLYGEGTDTGVVGAGVVTGGFFQSDGTAVKARPTDPAAVGLKIEHETAATGDQIAAYKGASKVFSVAGSGNTTTQRLTVQGAALLAQTSTEDDYAVGDGDCIISVGTRVADVDVFLPPANDWAGRILIVKDASGQGATYAVVLEAEVGETVDGASTKSITTAYGALRVYSDGANWFTW